MADLRTGRPATDLAVTSLDYGSIATSCNGNIRAKTLEACVFSGIDAQIVDLTVNNLTVLGDTIINNLDLDCEMNQCFLVDNRNINYCVPPFQTIQAAIDAVCASGLARAEVCISASTYNESPVVPANCATEIVFRGSTNSNESRTAETTVNGTWFINRPVTLDRIRIDGQGAQAVVLCSVAPLAGSTPYLLIHDSDLTSFNLPIAGPASPAVIDVNVGGCGTPGVFGLVRVDNSRIRTTAHTAMHSVNLDGNSGFITTGDTNLNGGEFWNNSTLLDLNNGALFVNSSMNNGYTIHQNSTTLSLRLQDIRFSPGAFVPFQLEVAGGVEAAAIYVVGGYIRSAMTTQTLVANTGGAPLALVSLSNVSDYGVVTLNGGGTLVLDMTDTTWTAYGRTRFGPEIYSGFPYTPVFSLSDGVVIDAVQAPGLTLSAATVTREGSIYTIAGRFTGLSGLAAGSGFLEFTLPPLPVAPTGGVATTVVAGGTLNMSDGVLGAALFTAGTGYTVVPATSLAVVRFNIQVPVGTTLYNGSYIFHVRAL
jgi:hypothetical protein